MPEGLIVECLEASLREAGHEIKEGLKTFYYEAFRHSTMRHTIECLIILKMTQLFFKGLITCCC